MCKILSTNTHITGHPDGVLGDFGDLQCALFLTVSGLFGKVLRSLRQPHYY